MTMSDNLHYINISLVIFIKFKIVLKGQINYHQRFQKFKVITKGSIIIFGLSLILSFWLTLAIFIAGSHLPCIFYVPDVLLAYNFISLLDGKTSACLNYFWPLTK